MRQKSNLSDSLEKWIKGWSLSRGLPLPVPYKSGFKVVVGHESQKIRYVFPEVTEDFIQLSQSINEPWIFLKVAAAPDRFKDTIPARWIIQPQGYMMACFRPMESKSRVLSEGYNVAVDYEDGTFIIRITTMTDALAATGRLILVDDLAIYDRIVTESGHRRKGLATFLMQELEKIALSKGVFTNFLVATEAGKPLYLSLGWEIYSLYTTMVIPEYYFTASKRKELS